MTTYALSPVGGAGWQFLDNSGNILSGGFLYTYLAGTTTAAETWADYQGNTSNGLFVQLDASGRPSGEIWLDTTKTYKFVVETSAGAIIRTYDHIPPAADMSILRTTAGAGYVGYDATLTYGSDTVGYAIQGTGITYAPGATTVSNVPVKYQMVIPSTEIGYRDNCLTLQNISSYADPRGDGRTRSIGNAAFTMKDPNGWERCAFGFSSVGLGQYALQPTWAASYFPNAAYIGISDLTGGAETYGLADFFIECTSVVGSPYFPGTTFKPIEIHNNVGDMYIRTRHAAGGLGNLYLDAEVFAGGIGGVAGFQAGMTTSLARLRERSENNYFSITTNLTSAGTLDDATISGWNFGMGAGTSLDCIRIQRTPAGSSTPATIFKMWNTGVMQQKSGLLFGDLPPANQGLMRAIITDGSIAAAGNFAALVVGGGANIVPVYSDGTNWRIG